MLAELYYSGGAKFSDMVSDVKSVLTGQISLSNLSTSLDKQQSSLFSTDSLARWELVRDLGVYNSTHPDLFSDTVTRPSLGGIILRQPCTTATGTYKYLKLLLVGDTSSSENNVWLAANLGKGAGAGNDLTDFHAPEYLDQACIPTTSILDRTSGDISTKACRFTIYSSPSATLIAVAKTHILDTKPVLAVLDFPKTLNADYCPTLLNIMRPATTSNVSKAGSWSLPPVNMSGNTYGSISGSFAIPSIATTRHVLHSLDANFVSPLVDASKRFAEFSSTSVKKSYDVMNFGISGMHLQRVSGSDSFLDSQAVAYASITDATGVYLIHQLALGKSGNYYLTSKGRKCKIGHYLVEVG